MYLFFLPGPWWIPFLMHATVSNMHIIAVELQGIRANYRQPSKKPRRP